MVKPSILWLITGFLVQFAFKVEDLTVVVFNIAIPYSRGIQSLNFGRSAMKLLAFALTTTFLTALATSGCKATHSEQAEVSSGNWVDTKQDTWQSRKANVKELENAIRNEAAQKYQICNLPAGQIDVKNMSYAYDSSKTGEPRYVIGDEHASSFKNINNGLVFYKVRTVDTVGYITGRRKTMEFGFILGWSMVDGWGRGIPENVQKWIDNNKAGYTTNAKARANDLPQIGRTVQADGRSLSNLTGEPGNLSFVRSLETEEHPFTTHVFLDTFGGGYDMNYSTDREDPALWALVATFVAVDPSFCANSQR